MKLDKLFLLKGKGEARQAGCDDRLGLSSCFTSTVYGKQKPCAELFVTHLLIYTHGKNVIAAKLCDAWYYCMTMSLKTCKLYPQGSSIPPKFYIQEVLCRYYYKTMGITIQSYIYQLFELYVMTI